MAVVDNIRLPYSMDWEGDDTLIRVDDLNVVRVFEIPDGYMIPAGAAISPEGTALWMGAWKGVDRRGSLLIFDVEAAGLGEEEEPTPTIFRPTYGQGIGRGYGGNAG